MQREALFPILIRGIIGIAGCISVKFILDHLYNRMKQNDIRNHLCVIGTMSMEIYILQSLFIENYGAAAVRNFIEFVGFNPFIISMNATNLFFAPLIASVSLVFLLTLAKLIYRIPLVGKYAFGFSYVQIVSNLRGERS